MNQKSMKIMGSVFLNLFIVLLSFTVCDNDDTDTDTESKNTSPSVIEYSIVDTNQSEYCNNMEEMKRY